MKNEYDESVIEWFPLKNGNIMVKIKEKEGVDDEDLPKKVNSQPCLSCFLYCLTQNG